METATYGSEFAASKTATENDNRFEGYLKRLRCTYQDEIYCFGDNRSEETSSTLPHSTLSKRHNILADHRIKEAIASNIFAYHWIQTGYNLSDMLSIHWDHPSVYNMNMKLLITRGPITLIPREATQEKTAQLSMLNITW